MKDYYINGRFLSQEATGVQRYAEQLVKTLDALIASGEIDARQLNFIILTPHNLTRTLNLKHIALRRVGRLSGHLWEQIELPWHARHGILTSLCNTAPLLKRDQIVTIHDAGFLVVPESYSLAFRTWYSFLLFSLGKIVRRVLTDSDFSRRELTRHIRIDPSKIETIPLGREHIVETVAEDYIIDRAGLSDRPFLLAVSSLSPRKNFNAVMGAIEKMGPIDFEIVIAGGTNPRVFGDDTVKLPDHVHNLGYVTDGELKSLYRHATAIIYPSLYEGFGLPPLEAMTCGCPVIVSDIPPHHEVCGEAAIYCDPHSLEDIAGKIALVMDDPKLRGQLIAAGYERAKIFSWRKSASQFYSVVKSLSISD